MKSLAFSTAGLVLITVVPLLAGTFYATGDTRDVFIPIESFYQQEQLAGRLPAWMPDAAWGFPVLASAQIGFFYPPLLLTRWLPIHVYLPLNLAAHLVFMALGTYFLLKKLYPERSRRVSLSNSAAFLGSISFTLSAFIFQHLTHLNIIFAITWFPWQILIASKFALSERSESKSNLAWLSLLLAIPFLAGQIQIPLLMALVTGAYYLYSSPHKRSAVLKLAVIAIFAIGLAMAQLLPTAELAVYSTRGANSDFDIDRANQYSWPPYHAPTLLFPRFFGNQETYWGKKLEIEQGFFIGTIPLLLALYSSFVLRHSSLRFFKWLTAVSFLLALGSLSPFRLVGFEPSLWFFSAPTRWLLFTTFGLTVLAAHGWDRMYTPGVESKVTPRGWVRVSLTIITLVFISNLALFLLAPRSLGEVGTPSFLQHSETFARDPAYYAEKLQSLLTSARSSSVSVLSPYTAIPIIILAAAPFLLHRRFGKRVLLAATTAELVIIGATANPSIPWKKIFEAPATISQLPENVQSKQARLYSVREADQRGLLLTDPTSNETTADRQQFRETLTPLIHTQFGLAGITWPAALDLSENATVLHELNESLRAGDIKLAEELNVGAILHPGGVNEGYSSGVDLQVLNAKPRASLRLADGREIPAEYREITPSHTQIKTSAQQESTLIVRDTFYPGWHATLISTTNPDSDPGSELEVLRTDRIFRAVSLPPGDHTIEMKYAPRLLYIGLTISGVSLLTIIALLLYKKGAKAVLSP